MLVIGLGHRARHGKNTVADEMSKVLKAHDYDAVLVMAFAEQLREFCRRHHEAISMCYRAVTGNELRQPKEDPVYGNTDILQWFGTDVARKLDENFWVKKLSRHAENSMDRYNNEPSLRVALIITDMRFQNEADWVKQVGGTTVKVERLNENGSLWISPDRDPNHLSETALNGYTFDYTITAYGIDQLKNEARSLALTVLESLKETVK